MPVNLYCTRAELDAEGFVTSSPSTAFWDKRIVMASQYIEGTTGRWFGAKQRTIRIDGTGKRVLPVPVPIVEINILKVIYESVISPDPSAILPLEAIRVYNRHLTQGLTEPDDRDAPRLEIESFHGYSGSCLAYFPPGSQNVQLTGYFGFTELESTDTPGETVEGSQIPLNRGIVPPLINMACMRIVARIAPRVSDQEAGFDATRGWSVTSERTRDQSRDYGGLVAGQLTGDPEIDGTLAMYSRPMRMAVLGDPRSGLLD